MTTMDLAKLYADVDMLLAERGYDTTVYSIDLAVWNRRRADARPDIGVSVWLSLLHSPSGACGDAATPEEALELVRAKLDEIAPPGRTPALDLVVTVPTALDVVPAADATPAVPAEPVADVTEEIPF